MIIQTVALVAAFGFAAFIVGNVTGHPGISMIGAVIVIGLGASMMTTGVDVKTGETREVVNTTDGQNVTVRDVHAPVEMSEEFPFDVVITLLGGVMMVQSTGRAADTDIEGDSR